VTGEAMLRSPLEARAADLGRVASATAGRVSIVEVPHLAQVSLRLDPTLTGRLAFLLPLEPNTVTGDVARGALWLGPDEWLLVGVPGTKDRIIGEVAAALAGEHHSVVDVSANRAVLELIGPDRHELLASGCSIDLHPRSWGPGRCAQSLFGRAQVLLQEFPQATRLFVRPSFAGYVVDRLLDAART
jgi:sarcosine oxidase, subunit gamma